MALATVVAIRGSTYRREGARLADPGRGRPGRNDQRRLPRGRGLPDRRRRHARGNHAAPALRPDGGRRGRLGLGTRLQRRHRRLRRAGRAGGADGRRHPAGDRRAARAGRRHRHRGAGGRTGVPGAADAGRAGRHDRGFAGRRRARRRGRGGGARALGEDRSRRRLAWTRASRRSSRRCVPPIRLLVCGAGHDAIPLVRFAAGLGWRVEVVDDRKAFLTTERFPEATGFVHLDRAGRRRRRATAPDGRTFPVVMTHNFMRDKDYLRVAPGDAGARTSGCSGRTSASASCWTSLRREGYEPDPADLRAVHSPAGLDLGAEGPGGDRVGDRGRDPRRPERARRPGSCGTATGRIHDRPHAAEVTSARLRAHGVISALVLAAGVVPPDGPAEAAPPARRRSRSSSTSSTPRSGTPVDESSSCSAPTPDAVRTALRAPTPGCGSPSTNSRVDGQSHLAAGRPGRRRPGGATRRGHPAGRPAGRPRRRRSGRSRGRRRSLPAATAAVQASYGGIPAHPTLFARSIWHEVVEARRPRRAPVAPPTLPSAGCWSRSAGSPPRTSTRRRTTSWITVGVRGVAERAVAPVRPSCTAANRTLSVSLETGSIAAFRRGSQSQ